MANIDTRAIFKKFIGVGFTEEQAELIVELSWEENYGNEQYKY